MGELKHKGALNTQQFEELKHATRERGVSAETSAHLDTLWGLRCDAILNEEEYDSELGELLRSCLLYTSPSPRDLSTSRMPSSA